MVHKAFEIIGEPVLIQLEGINKFKWFKLGIFEESSEYITKAEGDERPAIDFIHPIYYSSDKVKELSRGKNPKKTISINNPILSLHYAIDHPKLIYNGLVHVPEDIKTAYTPTSLELKIKEAHFFTGDLNYVLGAFCNDGNYEVYDKYRKALKKAGFNLK